MQEKDYEIIDMQDFIVQMDQDKCNACVDCIWERKVKLTTGETYNPYRLWEIMDSMYGL